MLYVHLTYGHNSLTIDLVILFSASSGFPKHLQNEPFYNDNISKSLTYTIGCQLVSIIPQPDDYACPICMCKCERTFWCSYYFCPLSSKQTSSLT